MTKSTKEKKAFSFQIENDWIPTRGNSLKDHPLVASIYKYASRLKKGESFHIPALEFEREFNWKTDVTISTKLRNVLVQHYSLEGFGVYCIKNAANKVVGVRVYKKG